MRRVVVIAAFALAAASCGGGGSSDGADGPSQSDSGAPASYETLREMQLDVEAAFILCNAPLKVYDPPLVEGATAQGDCTRDVALHIFDPADVPTGLAALQADPDGVRDLLVGTNWIIACTSGKGSCEKIQGIAGGELIPAAP